MPKNSALLDNDSQPRSSSNFVWLEKCKAPVQSFAALYWTWFNLLNWVCFKLWKNTIMPYSRTDLMVNLYKRFRVDLSKKWTLRKTNSFLFALRQVSWICFSQSRFDESHTPRCLWWKIRLTSSLFKISPGASGKVFFGEKIKSLLFEALNSTFHLAAHLPILSSHPYQSHPSQLQKLLKAN